jgi:hypothetical protein
MASHAFPPSCPVCRRHLAHDLCVSPVLKLMLLEGDFTLTISAFSPTHQGAFSLLVCSSRRVEVDPIPQEGAGMFNKILHGKWCVFFFSHIHFPYSNPLLIHVQGKWCAPSVRPRIAHAHKCEVCSFALLVFPRRL